MTTELSFANVLLHTTNLTVIKQLLNFIIAIIVDSYAKVAQSVEDYEAEQEFFTDLTSIIVISFKANVLRWPSKQLLIRQLRGSRVTNVHYGILRLLVPTWQKDSMKSFLHHYARYEFMSVTHEKHDDMSKELSGTKFKRQNISIDLL